MKKGFLVTFEGGEGCGKSTQIQLFSKYLEEQKFDFLLSREPGGSELGQKIREILLHSNQNISAKTEFLLLSSARSAHIEELIQPALKKGKLVVLDRYFDSSFAYQGYAGNLDLTDMRTVNNFVVGDCIPDLTILLDIPTKEGFSRKNKDEKLKNLDRIEQKGESFHEKVRKGYLQLAKENSNRIKIVDATKSVEDVHKEIVKIFQNAYQN